MNTRSSLLLAGVLVVVAALSADAMAKADTPCTAIPGSSGLFVAGKLLLLGELHGTRENPDFVGNVVCNALDSGLNVVVGLELSGSAQREVDRYLNSSGTEADREALLRDRLWQRSYQDGRTSRAMFELIDRIRQYRSGGSPVTIVMFDAPGGSQQRERAMAANLLRSIGDAPKAFHVVLTGNLHSRVVQGARGNSEYVPMGYLLKNALDHERVVSLDSAYKSGTAWVCNPGCGVSELRGRRKGKPGSIEMDDATRPSGHDGWYFVGAITASPPASGAAGSGSAGSSALEPSTIPKSTTRPEKNSAGGDPSSTASASPEKWQGSWQASQYRSKAWTIEFEGSDFHAVLGPDDWYRGTIRLRPEQTPAEIDFLIEKCRCDFAGKISKSIFVWDGDAVTLATPQPCSPRPTLFDEGSGQVVRLERAKE